MRFKSLFMNFSKEELILIAERFHVKGRIKYLSSQFLINRIKNKLAQIARCKNMSESHLFSIIEWLEKTYDDFDNWDKEEYDEAIKKVYNHVFQRYQEMDIKDSKFNEENLYQLIIKLEGELKPLISEDP